MARKLKPAHFEFGQDIILKTLTANPSGGKFRIDHPGTPIDGIAIEIPEGALEKEINISLGYNDGILELRAGKASGVTLH